MCRTLLLPTLFSFCSNLCQSQFSQHKKCLRGSRFFSALIIYDSCNRPFLSPVLRIIPQSEVNYSKKNRRHQREWKTLFESSEAVEIINASSVIEKCRGAGAAVDVRLS